MMASRFCRRNRSGAVQSRLTYKCISKKMLELGHIHLHSSAYRKDKKGTQHLWMLAFKNQWWVKSLINLMKNNWLGKFKLILNPSTLLWSWGGTEGRAGLMGLLVVLYSMLWRRRNIKVNGLMFLNLNGRLSNSQRDNRANSCEFNKT